VLLLVLYPLSAISRSIAPNLLVQGDAKAKANPDWGESPGEGTAAAGTFAAGTSTTVAE
jgi:hypothetical protein